LDDILLISRTLLYSGQFLSPTNLICALTVSTFNFILGTIFSGLTSAGTFDKSVSYYDTELSYNWQLVHLLGFDIYRMTEKLSGPLVTLSGIGTFEH